ncbi:hypothetical protein [Candidatus Avelusimicrobium sp.]
MTEKTNKRSGMLGTIYKMLPNIDDDYAAKLVYTLENKKDLGRLQQDIADISAQLGDASEMSDTIVAKILLDEITLPAALRQLRVYNNAVSVTELTEALDTPPQDIDLLLNYYAAFGSHRFFDTEFARALKEVKDKDNLSDAEKAQHALCVLVEQAKKDLPENEKLIEKNKNCIYQTADKYHLSVQITAALLALYTAPGAANFADLFQQQVQVLQKINTDENLTASLAAKALLCQITPKDAADIAQTSHLLKGQILEEDLMIIACRYLKVKTPQDIYDAFDAVLKRLPHVHQKEENLGLAVQVLLEGTEECFQKAQQKAALARERILLRKALSKKEAYNGYEYDIAQRFAGHKTYVQIEREMNELLEQLPYCQQELENKELACKVLLGTLSLEEARKQAEYLQNLKAQTLTKGLAPEALKNYLGTKQAEEITAFFEDSLAPYTFWKTNRDQHKFALQTLVGELNGTSNKQISTFVLDMLENGSSLELVADMLANIQAHKTRPEELEKLLQMYKKARVTSKEA